MNDDLLAALAGRRERKAYYETCGNYYAGRHELRFASDDWRRKYADQIGSVVLSIRENLCEAAVTAFTDGLEITSWGDTSAIDEAAAQGLSRLAGMIDREGYKTGDSFALVWPGADGTPTASFQQAHMMVPVVDDLQPDQLKSIARVWMDPRTKLGRVNLYDAQGVARWETVSSVTDAGLPEQAAAWRGCSDDDGDWLTHDFKTVPACWWKRDAPTQTGHGVSILDNVIPLQDALNKSLADLIVTSEGYSRPFWYLLNHRSDEAPVNPLLAAQGQQPPAQDLRRRFDPTRQQIFTTDGPGPFGQLDPPDLTRLLKVQDGFALKIARAIGVPSYYFTQTSGDVPSGESLRVLSGRRTARIKAWQRDAAPVWRGLKQLLGMGDDPVEWADPMPLDELDRLTAAREKRDLGYSLEDVLRDLGESDIDGVVERAQASSARQAEDTARAFLTGEAPANYGG